MTWLQESDVTRAVEELHERCLSAYEVNPDLVEEHFGIERSIAEGGYGRRQIYELVQNGADAALDAGLDNARIAVVLTEDALYCANEGDPITTDGVRAILGAHRSIKRGNQIGRFGLGFKSVLAVTDAPQFFSRSGSFRFDPRRARNDIGTAGADGRVPTLRLAYAIDPIAERRADAVLAELMEWATTVVRLPHGTQEAGWLHEDLSTFPAEFMLFSAHVGQLELDDRVQEVRRDISANAVDDEVELVEDDRRARWRLVTTEYQISDEARRTAGELSDRDSLPLVWAIPLTTTAERGWFWAFFPTEYWTTMRGIINAPWKTNADRQNLLKSEFNAELITQAAGLITRDLWMLAAPEDPGRYLDYLPGRGREAPQWADRYLTDEVYELCLHVRSVPDLDGVFRKPQEVKLQPADLPDDAVQLYGELTTDRSWAHPTVDTRSRRSRIERIMAGSGSGSRKVDEWFRELVQHADPTTPGACARVAARLRAAEVTGWENVPFIPTTSGGLRVCSPETVYFGGGHGAVPDNVHIVAPELADDPDARAALEQLGIRTLDACGQLEALLAHGDLTRSEAWAEFWQLTREVAVDEVVAIVERSESTGKVKALSRLGRWVRLDGLLIPGAVVATESSDDDLVTIDMIHHESDLQLLELLGATREPVADRNPRGEVWFRDYRRDQVKRFYKRPDLNGRRPQENLLQLEETGYAGPCTPLQNLSPAARTEFGNRLLAIPEACSEWAMRHTTQDYGAMGCPNPSLWMLRRFGTIDTSLGEVAVPLAVGPAMAAYARVLPVADLPDSVAGQLDLPAAPDEIPRAVWQQHLEAAFDDPERLGGLLALAIAAGERPMSSIEIDDGALDLASVVVCRSGDHIESIDGLGLRHAIVPDDDAAMVLVDEWGLRSATEYFTTRVVPIDADEPASVAELFPDLAALDPSIGDIQVVACDEIVVERSSKAGSDSETVDRRLEDGVLYVAGGPDNGEQILDAVLQTQGWQIDEREREHLLTSRRTSGGRALRRRIEDAASIEEKVMLAVGREGLVRGIPRQVVEEVENRQGGGPLDDLELARLASTIHGVEVLQYHRDDLAARGLDAPRAWAGGYSTRRFVLGLGFPEEYAGFQRQSRDSLVHVPGRPVMPPMHGFQEVAANNIRRLLSDGEGRGLLSLPTGAGKTRTAVQAIVEAIRDDGFKGPVLWVAQTDELCEQAVSAWADGWRAHGPRETLKLARLWSSNEAADLDDPHHVIVATMAKLEVVMDNSRYDWLSESRAVVVDEAHRATGPSYTRLLNWLAMGRGKERVPVIGLTATPFRGTSTSETETLVNRFNGVRLDDMGDDPYGTLQDMGVLSRVEHRLLAGTDLALTSDELTELQELRRLPPTVLERIGEDKGRNQNILESVVDLPEDHTVLLFAASVTHAELMASLLSLEGIPSRAISARTDKGARQHYIEQFRQGTVRVLTNYGVLTEGFDAPAVRAVYVARPTFSPNVYQQMIGRGLRGPLNGGKDVCLIVNVADNLASYGEALAFESFEYLWDRL